MLAKAHIGVEEYLGLVFDDRPEPDYVDGEVVERALPTPIHSAIQALLIMLLAPLVSGFGLMLRPELRVRISDSAFALSISRSFRATSRTAVMRRTRLL